VFTVYGIFHPVTGLCCYIGETGDFDGRKQAHLVAHRERNPKNKRVIFLKELHEAGHTPHIVELEHVRTNQESLAAETKWVELFASIGHPITNAWDEHIAAIKKKGKKTVKSASAELPAKLIAKRFVKDGDPETLGTATRNKKGTGYRLKMDDGTTIDLLPPLKSKKSTKKIPPKSAPQESFYKSAADEYDI